MSSVLSTSWLSLIAPLLVIAGIAACVWCLWPGRSMEEASPSSSRDVEPAATIEPFREVAAEAGLAFTHFNGMSGELYMVEMTGPGAALFDYDNDGDLDVYVRQGVMLGPDKQLEDATFPPSFALGDRLFRNELSLADAGSAELHFTDVSDTLGIDLRDYGMGVAAGDVNNDGWIDLYLTNFGPNRLLMNNGNGTFRDATPDVGEGLDDQRWSSSAAFVDFDRDGWLDLFLCNYVAFTYGTHRTCRTHSGAPDYCGPTVYTNYPDRLFRNRGDGTFEEVSRAMGIDERAGAALGVVCADFDRDGWTDIYVANDGYANHLWINEAGKSFSERAVLSGCAVNSSGLPEASMGVDAADFDGDGDEDLFMTHLRGEKNTLYVNDGRGLFRDASALHGLESPSHGFTAFGTSFLDYDNDGWLDLFVANGEVRKIEALARAGDPYPLHQTNQLFRNEGDGQFVEVTGGAAFAHSEVSRGVVLGDVDNDGDTDVLVLNNAGPARLLLNQVGQDRHWLGLRLVGGDVLRDMPGARVEIEREGKPTLHRRVRVDGSYLSSNDPRVLAGLGDDDSAVTAVVVTWPDGQREGWSDLAVDRYHTLRAGTGAEIRSTKSEVRNKSEMRSTNVRDGNDR